MFTGQGYRLGEGGEFEPSTNVPLPTPPSSPAPTGVASSTPSVAALAHQLTPPFTPTGAASSTPSVAALAQRLIPSLGVASSVPPAAAAAQQQLIATEPLDASTREASSQSLQNIITVAGSWQVSLPQTSEHFDRIENFVNETAMLLSRLENKSETVNTYDFGVASHVIGTEFVDLKRL